jgi:hypothetical protein
MFLLIAKGKCTVFKSLYLLMDFGRGCYRLLLDEMKAHESVYIPKWLRLATISALKLMFYL